MNTKPQQRLMSLDTLRGFDMLLIMGLGYLITSICNLFPNGAECWLAKNMLHAKWNGLTLFDTIFPLFLFIAGNFPFKITGERHARFHERNRLFMRHFIPNKEIEPRATAHRPNVKDMLTIFAISGIGCKKMF